MPILRNNWMPLDKQGVELPEAGAPGEGAGRDGHPAVAHGALAAYKKTLAAPVNRSSSWMRAASCCSPSVAAPWRLAARPRPCGNGTAATGSRPSARSPWPHADGTLGCTGCSTGTISATPRSSASSRCCADTCPAASPSSGIGIDRTVRLGLQPGSCHNAASWSSDCPPIHLGKGQ